MLYDLFRKIVFQLSPETAHRWTLNVLRWADKRRILFAPKIPVSPTNVMGLTFQNRVGLAAGLDKNGEYIDALSRLGFGFIEIGTVTRLPQEGNPKPRLFRLEKENALINRFGFNSRGADYVLQQLKKTRFSGILGVNIGKNRDTPLQNALEEYVCLFRLFAPWASYITLNISSPNTEKLRELQHGELLQHLLRTLKKEQNSFEKYVPLVVKISPDLTEEELISTANIILNEKMDGVIATNTTLSREGVSSRELGGVSGAPLTSKALLMLESLQAIFQNKVPLIASGGIMNSKDAEARFNAGAKLVQVYTGLIYEGPRLIKDILS